MPTLYSERTDEVLTLRMENKRLKEEVRTLRLHLPAYVRTTLDSPSLRLVEEEKWTPIETEMSKL